MKYRNLLVVAAVSMSLHTNVNAEASVSAKIIHESAAYTTAGSTIGDYNTQSTLGTGMSQTKATDNGTAAGGYRGIVDKHLLNNTDHKSGDIFKTETMLKLYMDGDLNDDSTYHIEFNGYLNPKAVTGNDDNESYTQRDVLREAYVDTNIGDWATRIGKQQVVWGTADGMKLLDTINPSDYTEMAQNQMEDSRIPVFMVNTEKYLEDGSSIQIVASQAKENIFAGLNRKIDTAERSNSAMSLDDGTLNNGTDTGHPFMLMGPDTITGVQNGFLNIVPDLGSVATQFSMAFSPSDAVVGNADDISDADDFEARVIAGQGYYTIGTTDVDYNDDNTTLGLNTLAEQDAALFAFDSTMMGKTGQLGTDVSGSYSSMMNYFTVSAFEAMTMSNVAGGLVGQATQDDLSTLPHGFRKAVFDTWGNMCQGGILTADECNPLHADYVAPKDLTGRQMLSYGFDSLYNTNLHNFKNDLTAANAATGANQDSAFEYMNNATFATFDAFANAKSKYVFDMPKDSDFDLAARYRTTTPDGVNLSFVASYNYDKNPIIDLAWLGNSGQKLSQRVTYHNAGSGAAEAEGASNGQNRTIQLYDAAAVDGDLIANANNDLVGALAVAATAGVNSMADSGFYGGGAQEAGFNEAYAANIGNGAQAAMGAGFTALEALRPTLEFRQKVKRVKQVGMAFDTSIENEELGPIVLRGEFLYTKDGYAPIIDKDALSYGNLVEALKMEKADRFKYVLGADITALTNMMVSLQFIQDSHLDFVDTATRYTADYSTMSMSNGFNKAIKNKNFYSLYLSKPFGESDQHRWNNITMLEEGGGRWNRLDVEYTIDDNTVATAEWNRYWGSNNTQFGQLSKSSNVQLGFKYTF